jgi:hypothetical protein
LSVPPSDLLRRVRVPVYLVAALVTVITLAEITVAIWPFQFGNVSWRISVTGVSAGAVGMLLLVWVASLAVAIAERERGVIWLVFVLSAFVAVFAAGGVAIFALDGLQVRGQVKPEMLDRYNLGFAWGGLKVILDGLAALGVAISAFRTGRLIGGQERTDRGAALLVKSSRPAPISTIGSGSNAP